MDSSDSEVENSPPGSPEVQHPKARPNRQKVLSSRLRNTQIQLDELHCDPNSKFT